MEIKIQASQNGLEHSEKIPIDLKPMEYTDFVLRLMPRKTEKLGKCLAISAIYPVSLKGVPEMTPPDYLATYQLNEYMDYNVILLGN